MAGTTIDNSANKGSLSTSDKIPIGDGSGTPKHYTVAQIAAAHIEDAINNGETTKAPTENAVFDALALKAPLVSPSLTTPSLGVATATSVNKVTVTAPATGATLTLADGSTLATSGAYSTTLTATGATNVTLPTSGTLATNSQVGFFAGFIESPSDKTYRVATNIPFGCTINSITTKSVSGTCTLTGKIDTVALGGTANSVSSSEQTQNHVSANTAASGTDIDITISSNSSCADLSFLIKYTRTLA